MSPHPLFGMGKDCRVERRSISLRKGQAPVRRIIQIIMSQLGQAGAIRAVRLPNSEPEHDTRTVSKRHTGRRREEMCRDIEKWHNGIGRGSRLVGKERRGPSGGKYRHQLSQRVRRRHDTISARCSNSVQQTMISLILYDDCRGTPRLRTRSQGQKLPVSDMCGQENESGGGRPGDQVKVFECHYPTESRLA